MHRQPLLKQLDDYQQRFPHEFDSAERIKNFVNEYVECFERTLSVGHITGSAWLINKAGDKALLTHHRKLNCWLQLGGHADGEANVLNVALREAREESGIEHIEAVSPIIFDIDVHDIPAHKDEPEHFHYDVRYLLRLTTDDMTFTISDESNSLRWVDADEVKALNLDSSVLRMIDKWTRHHK